MGREFIDLFEEWSKSYDDTVSGHDIEYQEVFKHYDRILDSVTDRAHGHVLEFGVGTGNLTERLLRKGLKVSGIEPSPAMRDIAVSKLRGKTEIKDGDFIDFPKPEQVDSIVSTYAFHHLTDEEKEKAIANYGKLLNTGGKIVFADTMYQSREAHERAIQDARQAGFHNLANDLQTEYYTTIPFLEKALEANGYKVNFERCNQFVWIMEAEKL
ncbi:MULTISPECIES: class I SAM-dependent DNA methyltransferase [Peribacillus]|uniref:class I SAM-dependent DNA methyltransferase n=1 Tax=Peribacillus TaxID=2675229 RepID=UPI001F4E0982|nr:MULTISPECIES: class I SAM-dependent methyltransferase [unclassified Peribacillus]MCK1982068.1 class I SAM-dependent methyltransferase [Peribacillus sp. Aquil_B1]MCK2007580.1 class I SAM-dependent methyltransferase [Peribacillus sp. Aquil_B8]